MYSGFWLEMDGGVTISTTAATRGQHKTPANRTTIRHRNKAFTLTCSRDSLDYTRLTPSPVFCRLQSTAGDQHDLGTTRQYIATRIAINSIDLCPRTKHVTYQYVSSSNVTLFDT